MPDLPPRSRYLVVALDGPAASGKSSTAQWVASELGFRHVDSGALYRAVTAAAIRCCGDPETWTPADVLRASAGITLVPEETSYAPRFEGEDLMEEVRGHAVTANVSRIAQMAPVRAWVNEKVREAAREGDIVVDGRDMGTAVFPDADLKVFLVADPGERARRRLMQRLARRPSDDEVERETETLLARDAADAAQTVPAADAIQLDTTRLTQADQVEQIVALAREAKARRRGEVP